MVKSRHESDSRRRFLRWLAVSPALAGLGAAVAGRAADPQEIESQFEILANVPRHANLITRPEDALDVFDFEPVAREKLPPAHFGDLVSGSDGDATVRANREGFRKYQIRMHRLIDVTKVDMSVRLAASSWDSPIFLSPVGALKAFHADGELAVAKAARSKSHLQILSTSTTTAIEDVVAARGAPVWFQLYPTDVWAVTRALIKRAESAGCPVVALTVDNEGGTNPETITRFARTDARACNACHQPGMAGLIRDRRMFDGIDTSEVTTMLPYSLDWNFVKRLKDTTPLKLFVKGIVTHEDAQRAVEHGVDGLIVSNHGGRAEDSGRSTIESLPEVVKGAAGRMPVLIDGGFRRGSDIFKALALGATAVGIGRPYLFGLAAFGQAGVEAVLGILRLELQTIMRQAGTVSLAEISPGYLLSRRE